MFSQPLWWRARQLRALLWPLFALSAWDQPATVVADMTIEGTTLTSNSSFGNHCCGGHVSCGGRLGLSSIGRSGHTQPLCWRARQVMALLYPLFERS